MKMIAKRFSSSSAGVLLEKSYQKKITECSGTKRLWGSLSLVKPYVVHLKKNFSIYFFLENFDRACFDEYFYKYFLKVDKTYLQIFFKTIFFKTLWADDYCRILWKIFFILSTFDTTKLFFINFFSFIWWYLIKT